MATGLLLYKAATSAASDSNHERLQVDANGYLQQVDSAGTAFPIGEYYLCSHIPDLSTAGSCFIAVPGAGVVTTIKTCIANAITAADAVVTAQIEDVAITGISITVTQSGSAAGDVDSDVPTGANTVAANNALEAVTDGGSSTACLTEVTFSVQRT